MDQRPQYKIRSTKSGRRERDDIEQIGTGGNFLNRTPTVQSLKSTTNKY